MTELRNWLHGLLGALIGGAASVGTGFVVGLSWTKLGQMALVSAVVSASLYLTKSPIWNTVTTTTLTETPNKSTLQVKEEKQ